MNFFQLPIYHYNIINNLIIKYFPFISPSFAEEVQMTFSCITFIPLNFIDFSFDFRFDFEIIFHN